jgi:hypothetical protein
MGWVGLLAVALAAVAYSDRTAFPGAAALLPTVGTALAIAAGVGGGHVPRFAVGRLLALRPMCIVGDRSYAFYLWHWPVLILADQYVGYELSVGAKVGLLVGAFLLSCASYALVENPIRRRVRTPRATGVVAAVSMAAVLATAGVSLAAISREQERFEASDASATLPVPGAFDSGSTPVGTQGALPEVVAAVEAARRGSPIPAGLTPPISQLRKIPDRFAVPRACISTSRSPDNTSKVCRLGATKSSKLIVLLGDSHAMMWLPAILEIAWRDGWAVVPLLRLGCRPDRWVSDCRDWYRWALREVRRLRPRVTLLGGSIAERQTPDARAGVDSVIAAATALKPLGDVVVIGDPEGLSESPADCLLSKHASMATCTTTWPAASVAIYDRIAARARQAAVAFLPTRGFLCFQRRCPAVIGHTIAYMDNSHLTVAYSRQTAGPFRAALQRAAPRAFR